MGAQSGPVSSDTPIAWEGEHEDAFPPEEAFDRVWTTLAEADEFGLERLFSAIARRLIGSYELVDDEIADYRFSYEQLGLLSAKTDELVEVCETLLDHARKLQELKDDVGRAASAEQGRLEHPPRFGVYGDEYKPSVAAMLKWGYTQDQIRAIKEGRIHA